jgi:hypothetical protein
MVRSRVARPAQLSPEVVLMEVLLMIAFSLSGVPPESSPLRALSAEVPCSGTSTSAGSWVGLAKRRVALGCGGSDSLISACGAVCATAWFQPTDCVVFSFYFLNGFEWIQIVSV